jgi:hypothetical protein
METIREMLTINLPYVVKSYLVDADWKVRLDSDMTGTETSWEPKPLSCAEHIKKAMQGGSWLVKTENDPQKYLAVFPLHGEIGHYVVEADSVHLARKALRDHSGQHAQQ